MKKLIVILWIVIAIHQNVKAQLFLTQTPEHKQITEKYYLQSADAVLGNTQKTVISKDNRHKVTITQLDQTHASVYRFIYWPNDYDSIKSMGDEVVRYFDLPPEYTVTDINLLDSLVVFCGLRQDINDAIPYIAYGTLQKLFDTLSVSFTITPFVVDSLNGDKIKSIRRIESYKGGNDTIIIAGIGAMYYGEPDIHIWTINEDNWRPMPKYDYDFLMFYQITESNESLTGYLPIVNPPSAIANKVYFYRNPIPITDTQCLNSVEHFEDLAITDNYLCMASTIFYSFDTNGLGIWTDRDTAQSANRYIIRRFDKKKFYLLQNSMISDISIYPIHPDWGIKLRHLTGNDVALAYARKSQTSHTIATIDKINMSDSIFIPIHTSEISDGLDNEWSTVLDIEYFKDNNSLLVLKNSPHHPWFGFRTDKLISIDMDNTTPISYSASRLYLYSGDSVMDNKYPYLWSDITMLNYPHYALTGCFDNKVQYLDKSFFQTNDTNCFDIDSVWIYRHNVWTYSNFPTLLKSNFGCIVLESMDMGHGYYTIEYLHSQKQYYVAVLNTETFYHEPLYLPIIKECGNNINNSGVDPGVVITNISNNK